MHKKVKDKHEKIYIKFHITYINKRERRLIMVNTTKEQQVIEKLNKYVPFYSSSSSSSCEAGNLVQLLSKFFVLIDLLMV